MERSKFDCNGERRPSAVLPSVGPVSSRIVSRSATFGTQSVSCRVQFALSAPGSSETLVYVAECPLVEYDQGKTHRNTSCCFFLHIVFVCLNKSEGLFTWQFIYTKNKCFVLFLVVAD